MGESHFLFSLNRTETSSLNLRSDDVASSRPGNISIGTRFELCCCAVYTYPSFERMCTTTNNSDRVRCYVMLTLPARDDRSCSQSEDERAQPSRPPSSNLREARLVYPHTGHAPKTQFVVPTACFVAELCPSHTDQTSAAAVSIVRDAADGISIGTGERSTRCAPPCGFCSLTPSHRCGAIIASAL